jgi:hypothetical protein
MESTDSAPSQHTRPLLGQRGRPGRLALAVFRQPLVLYRHGWGRLLGRTFMLLVHAGRKAGQPHPMTAMVMRYDPTSREVVIFSGWGPTSDWVRDIRARPALRVLLASPILDWPDLHSEPALRDCVRTHPFVALRPADAA